MSSTSRKILLLLVGVLVVAFLVHQTHGLSHFANFSGAKLLDAIKNANFYFLGLAVLLIYVCYAIRSARWHVFQKNLGASHFLTIFRMTLAGFGAVFLLGRAGEPARPLLIAREEKLPVADMFGIYVLERLFDAASTAVVASIALILFEGHAHTGDTAAKLEAAAKTTGTLLAVGVSGAVAFLIYLRLHGTAFLEARLKGWIGAPGWRATVARILLGFARGVQTIRTWSDLAAAVFYSALHWFLIVVVYFLVAHAFQRPAQHAQRRRCHAGHGLQPGRLHGTIARGRRRRASRHNFGFHHNFQRADRTGHSSVAGPMGDNVCVGYRGGHSSADS